MAGRRITEQLLSATLTNWHTTKLTFFGRMKRVILGHVFYPILQGAVGQDRLILVNPINCIFKGRFHRGILMPFAENRT